MAAFKLTLTDLATGDQLICNEVDSFLGGSSTMEKGDMVVYLVSKSNDATLKDAVEGALRAFDQLEIWKPRLLYEVRTLHTKDVGREDDEL